MNNERAYDWLTHAKGYLEAPKLCCTELIDPKMNRLDDDPEAPEGWHMPYFADLLLPVIFFNIKHGIEVFLKTLLLRMEIEPMNTHNIIQLFNLLNKRVKQIDWRPVEKEGTPDMYIKNVKEIILPNLRKEILYFANNEIIKEKLGMIPVPDPNNEIFRYPENTSGQSFFPFKKLIDSLELSDLQKLKKRIAITQRYLLNTGYMIAIQKKHFPDVFNDNLLTLDTPPKNQ